MLPTAEGDFKFKDAALGDAAAPTALPDERRAITGLSAIALAFRLHAALRTEAWR